MSMGSLMQAPCVGLREHEYPGYVGENRKEPYDPTQINGDKTHMDMGAQRVLPSGHVTRPAPSKLTALTDAL